MADHVLVPFEGAGSGVAELSWGQRELWGGMRRQRTWMPLRFIRPLPEGTTLDEVIADLRFLMSRYQSMRTRLRFDADWPARPQQVLASSGEIGLEIVDAGDHADPAEVAKLAEQVGQRFWDDDYDFATEWPVRMAVVRHRGAPTHLVSVMCHLVTDAFGATVMASELAGRDPQTGQARQPVTAMEPLEQARWQGSPAGQRHCERVLRHWEGILRTISPRRFPQRTDRPKPRPRYWHASFNSPAADLAVRAVAARTGVDTSAVLLAVFAVALARVTGINPVVTRVVVSNRFRRGLADAVSPISQSGLCVIDIDGITVDAAVARAQRRAIAAYKYAYYDPYQMDELVERVSRERGEEIDLACFFNDRRRQRRDHTAGPVPSRGQVRAALPESTFRWEQKQDDHPYERLFLHLDDVPGTLAVSAFADTHRVSPADLEACVRGMEEIAVAAASDPGTRTGVGFP